MVRSFFFFLLESNVFLFADLAECLLFLSLSLFLVVLTNLGEKLSDPEVDELLKGVEVDKGSKVNYEDFVKMILSS